MLSPTIYGGSFMFFVVRPLSVRPLTRISREAISQCSMERFQLKLATNIHHAEKIFKVRG